MHTHLQVGLTKISLLALRNKIKGLYQTDFSFLTGSALASFLTSKLFLVGSLTNMNPRTPAESPTIPMILKAHYQPVPVMMTIVKEERAPPK
jgi:hypothetical protein